MEAHFVAVVAVGDSFAFVLFDGSINELVEVDKNEREPIHKQSEEGNTF